MATPGALDATDRRYLGVGCFVWSITRGRDGVQDDGVTQVDPIGGLVVDVVEQLDEGTGELERAFVVVDVWRGRLRLRRVSERDVDRASMEPAGPGELGRYFRMLAKEIALGDRMKLRTGVVRPEHITMATYAHRLAELLA